MAAVHRRPDSSQDNTLLDFLLTEDDTPCVRKTSDSKNDISCDDLSQWMNSSITQASDFFKTFHTDNCSSDGVKGNLENQIETKGTDISESSNIDLVKLLRQVSVDSCETADSLDTTDSEAVSKKHESADEISDNDFLADIDLTFCIKKNSKNDSSFYGSSPETVDSGCDESEFPSNKSFSPLEGKFFYKDSLLSPTGSSKNKDRISGKVKQSLFSKAISAKPKIDDSRKLKLKNVMKELLKGSEPLLPCNEQINLKKSQRTIVDRSDEPVIASSYLKIGFEE